jgi:hypothetical protein
MLRRRRGEQRRVRQIDGIMRTEADNAGFEDGGRG